MCFSLVDLCIVACNCAKHFSIVKLFGIMGYKNGTRGKLLFCTNLALKKIRIIKDQWSNDLFFLGEQGKVFRVSFLPPSTYHHGVFNSFWAVGSHR